MKTAIRLWGLFRLLINTLAALGAYLMWCYTLFLFGVPAALVWMSGSIAAGLVFFPLCATISDTIPKWFAHYRVYVDQGGGYDAFTYIVRIRMLGGLIRWKVAEGNSIEELHKIIRDRE